MTSLTNSIPKSLQPISMSTLTHRLSGIVTFMNSAARFLDSSTFASHTISRFYVERVLTTASRSRREKSTIVTAGGLKPSVIQNLKELIEERRLREQLLWLDHLKEIARVGVQDAGIFDIRSGKITGSGGSFLIDESLLSQAAFIREGEFSETKGRPVFKIVGKVQPTGTAALGGIGKHKLSRPRGFEPRILF